MPLGFCFFAYFCPSRSYQRAMWLTLVVGVLVSLAIEVLQTYLPSRDSGTTDIITNTLGTYVGIVCYERIYPAIVRRFPWLGWFLSRS
jgi:glycopeptide antibiotics resistance protein